MYLKRLTARRFCVLPNNNLLQTRSFVVLNKLIGHKGKRQSCIRVYYYNYLPIWAIIFAPGFALDRCPVRDEINAIMGGKSLPPAHRSKEWPVYPAPLPPHLQDQSRRS